MLVREAGGEGGGFLLSLLEAASESLTPPQPTSLALPALQAFRIPPLHPLHMGAAERAKETGNRCEKGGIEMGASAPAMERSEIVFFDVETTVPSVRGQGYALLEFGAILVCPRRLAELGCYSTLLRPADSSAARISPASVRCNGITPDAVAAAPSFRDVADTIFDILHGRVWAGHNIVRFDCARIREAFTEIGRPAPEPRGTIDTLPLLTQAFGRRAGDMKMASLATYFGLGQQRHRSLDDVRLNLEVLKYCAAVLFLESILPDIFSMNNGVCEATITKDLPNENASPDGTTLNLNSLSGLGFSNQQQVCHMNSKVKLDVYDLVEPRVLATNADPSDLMAHMEQMKIDQHGANVEGPSLLNSPETLWTTVGTSEGCSGYSGYLEPNEVSTHCISASLNHLGRRILLHEDAPLQLCCMGLKIQFGISCKFHDRGGRPKLSIVVNIPASLFHVLDFCDLVAQRSSLDSGSTSEWIPVLRKNAYLNSSTVRLHIHMVGNRAGPFFSTEIYQKEPSGNAQKLVFSKSDASELELLFVPGTIIDAFFCVDMYDYQQRAGIRLVAKRLVLYSK